MRAQLTPERVELVRIVREHCTQCAEIVGNGSGDIWLRQLAEAALAVPIEEMAGWFDMRITVLDNIRLAMQTVADEMSSTPAPYTVAVVE